MRNDSSRAKKYFRQLSTDQNFEQPEGQLERFQAQNTLSCLENPGFSRLDQLRMRIIINGIIISILIGCWCLQTTSLKWSRTATMKKHSSKTVLRLFFIRDLLALADWRNVNIGLRGNERHLMFVRGTESSDSSGSSDSGSSDTVSERQPKFLELRNEEENLQNTLWYIQALEKRNKSQLMSFVDEKHQWESQSQEDRDALLQKPRVVSRLKEIRALLNQS
jgi:hypothetical protein